MGIVRASWVLAGVVLAAAARGAEAQAPPNPPWTVNQDIAADVAGTTGVSGGVFTVEGGGPEIWNLDDHFRFVAQAVSGNVEIVARVTSLENTDPYAKGGIMIRETLGSTSKHAFAMVNPTEVAFQHRGVTGGISGYTPAMGPAYSAPRWLRLLRVGNDFYGFSSPDGSTWTPIGMETVPMGPSVYVGLAVTSSNPSTPTLCTAVFDNVSVTVHPPGVTGGETPVPPGQGSGLRGQYWDTTPAPAPAPWPSSAPARDVTDAGVNFDDFSSTPPPGSWPFLPTEDGFLVRWTGSVVPRVSGPMTFNVLSDDGARLWVDGQLVIDDWAENPTVQNSATVALNAGVAYDLRLEYYENAGGARVRLSWTNMTTSQPLEPIPSSQLLPTPSPAGGAVPPWGAPPGGFPGGLFGDSGDNPNGDQEVNDRCGCGTVRAADRWGLGGLLLAGLLLAFVRRRA